MSANGSFQVIMAFLFGSLVGCQNIEQHSNLEAEGNYISGNLSSDDLLSTENDQLDLSLDTLEQQIKDKTAAAEKLKSARKQRILIETKEFQQNEESINIATFARSSPNKKGESIYLRPAFQTFDHWTECAFFTSNEKAQRFFLKTGGPKKDLKNLDPDGDGFACDWDPIIYRQLVIPSD